MATYREELTLDAAIAEHDLLEDQINECLFSDEEQHALALRITALENAIARAEEWGADVVYIV